MVSKTFPFPTPIYEFGSFQVGGQEGYADLRPLFPDKQYFGCDLRKGTGVDLVLDLHNINVPDETVGTVLIIDTLEHVEFCRRAMSEVYRILKPGGITLITSVMNFPIHDYPKDYWRFTPEGFSSLLKEFSYSLVEFLGKEDFPHTVLGMGIKGVMISEEMQKAFVARMAAWKSSLTQIQHCGGVKALIKQFVPPILIGLYKKLK